MQRAAIDAVEEARGVPPEARDPLQATQHVLKVRIPTNWGDTTPVQTERGALQGMGCAPEASKPGQDAKLRLRENSAHKYTTHHGREVAAGAYADDGRHYTDGAASAQRAQQELSVGGAFSGNSANAAKSFIYASDYDEHCSTARGRCCGFRPNGLTVTTADVYSGNPVTDIIPRATLDTPDKFFCKW